MLQANHLRIHYGENPPFFMTLAMNNKYLNNCMLDTGCKYDVSQIHATDGPKGNQTL
jgi:hypothetical protein